MLGFDKYWFYKYFLLYFIILLDLFFFVVSCNIILILGAGCEIFKLYEIYGAI